MEYKITKENQFERDIYVVKNDPLFEFFGRKNILSITKRHLVNMAIKNFLGIKLLDSGVYHISNDEGLLGTDLIINNIPNIFNLPADILQSSIELIRSWKNGIINGELPNK